MYDGNKNGGGMVLTEIEKKGRIENIPSLKKKISVGTEYLSLYYGSCVVWNFEKSRAVAWKHGVYE